jgi:sterol desaturase/sphingolipid hydroxylase (fatty acid hydroxylase superfamily)
VTKTLTSVAVATTLIVTREPLIGLVALFVLVVPFEKLYPRHRQPVRRPMLATDLAWSVLSTPLSVVAFVGAAIISIASLVWLPALLLRPIVDALPDLLRVAVGVILFDLVTYWAHRFGHEIPLWWRFHRIHHSTLHLDWVSGFRNHPLDGVLLAPAFVFLLVAGFSPELSGALVVVQVVTGLFLHANVRFRWRPLHRVVITPEFHHWHHSNEPDAHCSNYSVFLPLWDIVFGTYFMPRDRRPAEYGVDGPVSIGVVGQLIDPFRGLPDARAIVRHPIAAIRHAVRVALGGLRLMRHILRTRPRAFDTTSVH